MRERLKTAAKLAISLGLLGYLSTYIDLSTIDDRLFSAPLPYVLGLIALAALQIVGVLVRWRLVLARSGESLSATTAVSNVCMGLMFNQVLLSAIGGDAVRIVDLTRRKLGVERAVQLIFVDRLTAILGMTLLISVALPGFFLRDQSLGGLGAAGLALIPLAVGGCVGVAMLMIFPHPPLIRFWGGIGRPVIRFWHALRLVLTPATSAVSVLGLAVLIHVFTCLNVYSFAVAFGVPVSFYECVMLAPPVILLATLPLSIGGWGVREGGFVIAFALIGVGNADALALSVGLGLLGVAQGMLGGVIWLTLDFIHDHRRNRQ
jgi:glycosyltransferase 2 family protein